MLRITICVGSSCSVRGSDELAEELEKLIEREHVAAQVELVGSFCMGECSKGVSVQVADTVYREVHPADAKTFFFDKVMPLISAEGLDE